MRDRFNDQSSKRRATKRSMAILDEWPPRITWSLLRLRGGKPEPADLSARFNKSPDQLPPPDAPSPSASPRLPPQLE